MEKQNIRDRASYESNSHISKEEKKREKVQRVTSGKVSVRKQSALKKFTSSLFASNSKSIKDYILEDILIPNIKDLLYSMGVGSLGMLLLGEDDVAKRSKRSGYSYDKPSYASSSVHSSVKRNRRPAENPQMDFREVTFETKEDAEDVLYAMKGYIEEYGSISLLIFYEMAGVDMERVGFRDDDYGWFGVENARVLYDHRIKEWYITLPRAVSLD